MYKNLTKTGIVTLSLLLSAPIVAQEEVNLETDDQKFSYAIGMRIGQSLIQQVSSQPGINMEIMLQGLTAVVSGTEPKLTAEQAVEIINQKQQQQLAEAAKAADEKVESNNAFLEENKSKEGVQTTASGAQYTVLESGDGAGQSPSEKDTVVVHYEGKLTNGTVFDSSYTRGEPATFSLGSVIPGWTEVLQLMKPGDKWSIVLPPELAYGERGAGQSIGPNEILLFDVELLEVKKSEN